MARRVSPRLTPVALGGGERAAGGTASPTVTVVFLAFNRREPLRLSLEMTLQGLEYDGDRLHVIVVDNGSTDGTAAMLASDFPSVQVIERAENTGVSGWNDGFATAPGDYVLALDDDCYLEGDALRRAIGEAEATGADLVSFGVKSAADESYRFDLEEYLTGLFSFWGCAVVMRREVLQALVGYDPEIFVSLNELEFMLRFFDRGYRHLHLPEVVAVHAKEPGTFTTGPLPERSYRLIYRNFGYIVAKHLRPVDCAQTLVSLLARNLRDAARIDRVAIKAPLDTLRGFSHGIRHRKPVRPEVSTAYRRNFESFAPPWALARSPLDALRGVLRRGDERRGDVGRRDAWLAARARFYPERSATLDL